MPAILMIFYAGAQIVASLQGLEHYLGVLGALFAVCACLYFRFTLPLTIAAFLCVTKIWGWHWFFALLFVAPGLAFMLPAIATVVIASLLALIPVGLSKRKPVRPDDGIIEGEYEEVFEGRSDAASSASPPPPPRQPRITDHRAEKSGGRKTGRIVVILLLVGGIGAILGYAANERPRQEPLYDSYNETANSDAPVDFAAQSGAIYEEPAEAPLPAVTMAEVDKAVAELDRVLSANGMSGVMSYSQNCHGQLSSSRSAEDFDFCTSFDIAAALIEQAASTNGFPPQYYFREITTPESMHASARLISSDDAATANRVQQIKANTTDAFARLANRKLAARDAGAAETADYGENSNSLY